LISLDGQSTDTHLDDFFVDDTMAGATDDDHLVEPVPTNAIELMDDEARLFACCSLGRDHVICIGPAATSRW
jgi:hypothetical protein